MIGRLLRGGPSIPRERELACDPFWERAYRESARPLAFRTTTTDEWLAWRTELHTKLRELLGHPRPAAPLRAEVLERVDCGAYIREYVVYDSEPGASVSAFVLVPKDRATPRPALLCFHGHAAAGKEIVAGISRLDLRKRRAIARFHKNIGERFVRRGYTCLCPDARGWGDRSDGFYRASRVDARDPFGGRRDPCNVHFLKAQLLGMNLMGLNVWDDLRGLDYLASRADVDARRIGAFGFSYGGTRALFAGALDERVRAVDVSVFLSSFLAYGLRANETCGSQVVPGILQWCELADVAALVAPRPILFESGRRDPLFPIDAAREAFETIRACYAVAGAPERCAHEIFDGGHMFAAAQAFDFMERWVREADRTSS